MTSETLDSLKSLHTNAIDARNGYQEALEDAEGKGMTPLFRDMIAMHEQNAGELSREITRAGDEADKDGSFMSTIHKTIMSVRSLFDGLDESVLPGLIDGEERNRTKYSEAIESSILPDEVKAMLLTQRGRIEHKIAAMRAQEGGL